LTGSYNPPLLKGIKTDSDNPLRFEFIFDEGAQYLTRSQLETETKKLIGYFLCAMAIPEEKLWVNLSPNEQDRIIPNVLGKTGMGEAMLEEDYLLKQLAASLTFPETEAGRKYWADINNARVPTNNFQKVWIMPESAEIYCDNDKAFITKNRLKVLTQEDYGTNGVGAGSKPAQGQGQVTNLPLQSFKDNILPLLEQEVNNGKHFIQLRQMYNALLLAVWFKKHLKENILSNAYTNKQKINGIEASDAHAAENIYQKYMTAFKTGAYDYTKSEQNITK
jgi:hypothetical protein